MKIAVIGGDKRNIKLGEYLIEDKLETALYGFDSENISLSELKNNALSNIKMLKEYDIVVGPTPFSRDGVKLNAPLFKNDIYIKDLADVMKKDSILIATKISNEIRKYFNSKGIKVFDLFDNEQLAVLNAIPTAEGAIQFAMENTSFTLHQSKALILGYGRIGKVLSKMLKGIGANVSVEARKTSDLAWIEAMGYTSINLNNLDYLLGDFDIIFNTIPALILDKSRIQLIKKECLIVDLSTNPGGVDFEFCRERGINASLVLGVPGKVAPDTAAKYIKNAVKGIIKEVQ